MKKSRFVCIGQKTYGEEDPEKFCWTNNIRTAQKACEWFDQYYVDTRIEYNK